MDKECTTYDFSKYKILIYIKDFTKTITPCTFHSAAYASGTFYLYDDVMKCEYETAAGVKNTALFDRNGFFYKIITKNGEV